MGTDQGVPKSLSYPYCLPCLSQHDFKIPAHFPVTCVPTGAEAGSAWLIIFGHVSLLPSMCLTLCDPLDCSSPGSSAHVILQARILECPYASAIHKFHPTPYQQDCWSCKSVTMTSAAMQCMHSLWSAKSWSWTILLDPRGNERHLMIGHHQFLWIHVSLCLHWTVFLQPHQKDSCTLTCVLLRHHFTDE